MGELGGDKLSKNTKHAISGAIKIFVEYGLQRNVTLSEIDAMTPYQLDEFLSKFYAEVKKGDGSLYSKNAIIGIRYGLQKRFLKNGFDIINDKQFFTASNTMFTAVLVKLKREGKDIVQHKQPITIEDFEKLYSSYALDTSHPEGLQNKVFVDIMIHLCNSGRENLREMNHDDFQILTDECGRRYVCLSGKLLKKHRGDSNEDRRLKGRMYEMPGHSRCPVSSFENYLSKLHAKCKAFWQKPNRNYYGHEGINWYCEIPLGANTLGKKMSKLSAEIGLSQSYTNHCLRAACISALDQQSFEARQCMVLPGLKSIRPFGRQISDKTMHAGSHCKVISSHISGFTQQQEAVTNQSIVVAIFPQQDLQLGSLSGLSTADNSCSDTRGESHHAFHLSDCSVNILYMLLV